MPLTPSSDAACRKAFIPSSIRWWWIGHSRIASTEWERRRWKPNSKVFRW